MTIAAEPRAATDAQRAKLMAMFCALGLSMFVLDVGAGLWLWHYLREVTVSVPDFDVLLSQLRAADPKSVVDLGMGMRESWAACEEARAGVLGTILHAALAASFVGLALFGLCLVLSLLLYRSLSGRPDGRVAPLLPDDVDGTWRQ
ncbi:MAG TPA: hypothetical protein VFV71_12800 [Burkholderiales bacterium]|nr:hypothetical protein [Burkholderiales bacterium]